MKLYSYYRSSCSYRVRIALNHKNLPYEYIPVHLVKDGGEQHKKSYSDLNPKEEVPTIVDKNITLSQSMAILLYLDRIQIENPIFPKELPLFENCIELCEIINSGTQPLQNLSVLQKLQNDFKITDDQKNDWCKHFIESGLKAYNNKLKMDGPFSMGEEVSAADMFLIPQIYNAKRFKVDMSKLGRLLEIESNCLKLKSFQEAIPEKQIDFN